MEREDIGSYITDNWEWLKSRAVSMLQERLDFMEPWEVTKRLVEAGEKYGPFDPNTIDIATELDAECKDIVAYLAIGDHKGS